MDWKCICGAQISGLICLALFFSVSAEVKKKEGALVQFDSEIRKVSGSLDSIKVELDRGRIQLKELQKEEGNFLEQLDLLEKNISSSRTYLSIVAGQIDSIGTAVSVLNDSLIVAQNQIVSRKQILEKRFRLAYMSGNPSWFEILVNSKSFNDALHRVTYFRAIKAYDQSLIAQIDTIRQTVSVQKGSLEEKQRKLSTLLARKTDEQQQLLGEESSRKKMLVKVQSEKKAFQQMIAELENSHKALNEMIRLLEKKKKKAQTDIEQKATIVFEQRKGKLPWPVEGPLVGKFGKIVHPVYQTIIMNNGVDIGANKGEAVFAVAPGVVMHTGWMRGLGKIVIIDHAGGYITVYAHLDEITVVTEQNVSTSDIIGRVGDTGALGSAKLHFEIRKSSETLDPSEWLTEL